MDVSSLAKQDVQMIEESFDRTFYTGTDYMLEKFKDLPSGPSGKGSPFETRPTYRYVDGVNPLVSDLANRTPCINCGAGVLGGSWVWWRGPGLIAGLSHNVSVGLQALPGERESSCVVGR